MEPHIRSLAGKVNTWSVDYRLNFISGDLYCLPCQTWVVKTRFIQIPFVRSNKVADGVRGHGTDYQNCLLYSAASFSFNFYC